MDRTIITLSLCLARVLAVAGPYYLGYDCPDSCCDRVKECGNLPGTYSQTETREDLLKCLGAVDPSCYVDAHLGFSLSGFDLYIYRNFRGDDSTNALLLGLSFEDLFRAYPDFYPDATGLIMMDSVDDNCDWLSACLLYGADNKSVQCLKPDMKSEGAQNDIMISMWKNVPTGTATATGYKFDSHRLSYDYSHMLVYIDKISSQGSTVGCSPPIGDGSGRDVYVTITGQIKNIRRDMVLQSQTRLGQDTKYEVGSPI